MNYPADYPDKKLAGKHYSYVAEVLGIKEKKLPELNDEFVKAVSESRPSTSCAPKSARASKRTRAAQQRGGARRDSRKIIAAHEFPVPEALVENQMDTRLERAVRMLGGARRGPARGKRGLGSLRQRQHDPAVDDVKAELLLDRIATAENIEASEEDLEHELNTWRNTVANGSGGSRQLDKARCAR